MRALCVACVAVPAVMILGGGFAWAHASQQSETPTLVYVRDFRVMLMQADGSSQRPAPFGPYPAYPLDVRDEGYPVYSRDGRRVVFAFRDSNDDNAMRLVVANADGSGRRTLARRRDCISFHDWSPDGRRIAYTVDCDYDFTSVWVVDRDGKHRKRLTGRWNLDPKWSPDGRTILFTSWTNRRGWRLYLMDADGRRRREIRGRYTESSNALYRARWSRNGRRIFFMNDAEKRLFVMNRDGTGVRNLTPPGLDIGAYTLSPDERLILVHGVTKPATPREIFLLRSDGTDVRQLTDAPGADEHPAWSPDGSMIAFTSHRDGNAEIYVMNAGGSGQTNLTRNPGDDRVPSWVPARR